MIERDRLDILEARARIIAARRWDPHKPPRRASKKPEFRQLARVLRSEDLDWLAGQGYGVEAWQRTRYGIAVELWGLTARRIGRVMAVGFARWERRDRSPWWMLCRASALVLSIMALRIACYGILFGIRNETAPDLAEWLLAAITKSKVVAIDSIREPRVVRP